MSQRRSQDTATKAGTASFPCPPGSGTSPSFPQAQFTKNRTRATASTREAGGEGAMLTQELPTKADQRSTGDSSRQKMPKQELL